MEGVKHMRENTKQKHKHHLKGGERAFLRLDSVTVLPVDTELTTQQAAELLRVSRPSLIKMLDEKKLPYRKVGAHRRVRYEDVLNYLETERARRKRVMEELVAETERLHLPAQSACR